MNSIVWKPFTLSDLFDFDSGGQLSLNKKALDISSVKDETHTIALVTQSEKNGGISGYIKADDEVMLKLKRNCLSYSMHFGLCFYHDYDFVLMDTHGSVFTLVPKSLNFSKILESDIDVNIYIARMITYICHNDIYNYMWLPNSSRVGREIILLPCIEVEKSNNYILEDSGKYFSLASDYIKYLISSSEQEKRNQNNKLLTEKKNQCENAINDLDIEKKKIEKSYLKEKSKIRWLPFTLGYLFERSGAHVLTDSKKSLNETICPDETHTIKNITATKANNGCSGYLVDEGEVTEKKKTNFLTLSMNGAYGGICFYQDCYFVSSGDNNLLVVKNQILKKNLDSNPYCYSFLAKVMSVILRPTFVNRFLRKVGNDFEREIILLPCVEVNRDSDYFYEQNGHYFNLATSYINYIYIEGEINYNKKMISSASKGLTENG